MSPSLLSSPSDALDTTFEIPEKFRDPATGALRVEALLKSYCELERRLSQRMAPPGADAPEDDVVRYRQAMGIPATPGDYSITPPHDLCCADDAVNQRLHSAHFSQDQAQLVYDLAAEKLLPLLAEAAAQYEAEQQLAKLHQHFGGAERYRQVAAQLADWGRANLPPAVFAALSSTSEGVLALEQMLRGKEPSLARNAEAPAAMDEAALRQMMRDPRYWRTREPAFVQKVTEGFRRVVGN